MTGVTERRKELELLDTLPRFSCPHTPPKIKIFQIVKV